MADSGRDDWTQAAVSAAEAGLGGRPAAILFEGVRFERPSTGADPAILPGVRLQPLSDLEREALVLAAVAADARIPDPRAAVRLLQRLGVTRLLVMGDAEPLRDGMGSWAAVRDHVNLGAANPLVGANDDRFGPRFPDMSEAYDPVIRARLDAVNGAGGGGIVVGSVAESRGVEIVADAATWSGLGVDAVTEGVVPSVIVARHAGIRIAATVAFGAVDSNGTRRLVEAFLDGP